MDLHLKNCEKVNCEQRVEMGTLWKRTYVIEVLGLQYCG